MSEPMEEFIKLVEHLESGKLCVLDAHQVADILAIIEKLQKEKADLEAEVKRKDERIAEMEATFDALEDDRDE